jgi:hypothetical protein
MFLLPLTFKTFVVPTERILGAVKIEPWPRKIFLFEKSFSRLFSVQENNLAARISIQFRSSNGSIGEEIRDVTEFRFYFF